MANGELTVRDLRQLEAKPKTLLEKTVDRLICTLPLIISALVIIQYKFAPNFKQFTSLDRSKPTDVYFWFIGIFVLVFLARNIAAIFSKREFDKLRYGAPVNAVVFFLFFLYDWATLKTGLLPLPYFPWPDAILNAIIDDRITLLISIQHSLILLFTGYIIGGIVGLVCGVAAGWSEKARYWVWPVVKVLGPIPSTTWLPIILIVATSLFGGSVFLIALGVWYPVTMTTMAGVINIPKSYFEAAQTFGSSKARMLFKVAIPAASPYIFQGFTQGMSIACTALLIAEMMGVDAGLGWYINWQRGWAEFAKMYAAVIIICLTFLTVNTILTAVKKRVLRWKEGSVI
jgi:NitT/TauT family transport system permease protein